MAEKYRIGAYEFETREAWENALDDVKKIESIVDRIDIDDPEHVLSIYKLIRNGKIKFKSELGAVFLCDLSDRVAQYSQMKMAEKPSGKTFLYKVAGIAFMVLAIICFLVYGYFGYREKQATRKLEEQQNQKDISRAIGWYVDRVKEKNQTSEGDTAATPQTTEAESRKTLEILQEYQVWCDRNPDFAGWLQIDDTQINLPVLKTTDNEYYLHKDIDKNDDINGTLLS